MGRDRELYEGPAGRSHQQEEEKEKNGSESSSPAQVHAQEHFRLTENTHAVVSPVLQRVFSRCSGWPTFIVEEILQ